MRVIRARGVNDAWPAALDLIYREGTSRPSRNGEVLVHPEPVATVYSHPTERVIFDPVRDANPIFHLHEALWMLAGRDDATFLDQYVSDFSRRFAESGGRMHGAYGRRWRGWFSRTDRRFDQDEPIDQIDEVVRLLRSDPYDRQAVIQMWDAELDLGVPGLLDRPCNTQIYLRCDRTETSCLPAGVDDAADGSDSTERRLLDMTVTCRSNDIVFGCYGANAVHFSILQEYLAARIGVSVGTYTQMSNNWHMYESSRSKADMLSATESYLETVGSRYPGTQPLVDDPETFDRDVRAYLSWVDSGSPASDIPEIESSFLLGTALPMHLANQHRKQGRWDLSRLRADSISAPDWRRATLEWLGRRAPA